MEHQFRSLVCSLGLVLTILLGGADAQPSNTIDVKGEASTLDVEMVSHALCSYLAFEPYSRSEGSSTQPLHALSNKIFRMFEPDQIRERISLVSEGRHENGELSRYAEEAFARILTGTILGLGKEPKIGIQNDHFVTARNEYTTLIGFESGIQDAMADVLNEIPMVRRWHYTFYKQNEAFDGIQLVVLLEKAAKSSGESFYKEHLELMKSLSSSLTSDKSDGSQAFWRFEIECLRLKAFMKLFANVGDLRKNVGELIFQREDVGESTEIGAESILQKSRRKYLGSICRVYYEFDNATERLIRNGEESINIDVWSGVAGEFFAQDFRLFDGDCDGRVSMDEFQDRKNKFAAVFPVASVNRTAEQLLRWAHDDSQALTLADIKRASNSFYIFLTHRAINLENERERVANIGNARYLAHQSSFLSHEIDDLEDGLSLFKSKFLSELAITEGQLDEIVATSKMHSFVELNKNTNNVASEIAGSKGLEKQLFVASLIKLAAAKKLLKAKAR